MGESRSMLPLRVRTTEERYTATPTNRRTRPKLESCWYFSIEPGKVDRLRRTGPQWRVGLSKQLLSGWRPLGATHVAQPMGIRLAAGVRSRWFRGSPWAAEWQGKRPSKECRRPPEPGAATSLNWSCLDQDEERLRWERCLTTWQNEQSWNS